MKLPISDTKWAGDELHVHLMVYFLENLRYFKNAKLGCQNRRNFHFSGIPDLGPVQSYFIHIIINIANIWDIPANML